MENYRENAEPFSTRKQNEYGRSISILSINRGGRLVLIIPKTDLNAGWCDIAFKIENFINVPKRQEIALPPKLTEINYPYAKAIQESKWPGKTIREAEVRSKKGRIEIDEILDHEGEGLLTRCLVGNVEQD